MPRTTESTSAGPPARVTRLARLAAAPERRILGLMSGTSLDGLDLALCRIAGNGAGTRVELERFATQPYAEAERARLREVAFREQVALRRVTQLHGWLAERHAAMVLAQLAEWDVAAAKVDAIASHGQTVFHAPLRLKPGVEDAWEDAGHATLQLGDGDRLARRTGILTVSDFRQAEIAAGGEGAPLAPYAEALCFAEPGRSRILLNIGGIANFTWLPPAQPLARWMSGDTGPGNTLIDAAMRRYFPERTEGFDPNGAIAAEGLIDPGLLAHLKEEPYFARPFPKSTGPEEFGTEILEFAHRAADDSGAGRGPNLVATFTRLTAETIADALRWTVRPLKGAELFASGGGARNRTLMRWLAELLPEVTIADTSELGIDPGAKEAVLFAVLANETLAGAGFPSRDGSERRVAFGKLSFAE